MKTKTHPFSIQETRAFLLSDYVEQAMTDMPDTNIDTFFDT